MILLDTNILVYAADSLSPRHRVCRQLVDAALDGDVNGVVSPQVLLEFYATLTGHRALHPLKPEIAWELVESLRSGLNILPVGQETIAPLRDLLKSSPRPGQHVYDLFLVATMRANRVEQVCTDDHGFEKLGVTVRSPEEILSTIHVDQSLTR